MLGRRGGMVLISDQRETFSPWFSFEPLSITALRTDLCFTKRPPSCNNPGAKGGGENRGNQVLLFIRVWNCQQGKYCPISGCCSLRYSRWRLRYRKLDCSDYQQHQHRKVRNLHCMQPASWASFIPFLQHMYYKKWLCSVHCMILGEKSLAYFIMKFWSFISHCFLAEAKRT